MAMTDVALLEREMYAEAEARLLNVAQSTLHYWLEGKTGRGGKGLEVLMRHWRAIEALATRPGPFVYTATRSALKAVDLD